MPNLALLPALRAAADELDATIAQVALAWVVARGAIPGTRDPAYLEENLAARQLRLFPAQLAALDAAFPPGAARGDRYPAAAMSTLVLYAYGSKGMPDGLEAFRRYSNEPSLILMVAEPKFAFISVSRSAVLG